jgi:hypothetical protein
LVPGVPGTSTVRYRYKYTACCTVTSGTFISQSIQDPNPSTFKSIVQSPRFECFIWNLECASSSTKVQHSGHLQYNPLVPNQYRNCDAFKGTRCWDRRHRTQLLPCGCRQSLVARRLCALVLFPRCYKQQPTVARHHSANLLKAPAEEAFNLFCCYLAKMWNATLRCGSKLASVNRSSLHNASVRMFGAKPFVSVPLTYLLFTVLFLSVIYVLFHVLYLFFSNALEASTICNLSLVTKTASVLLSFRASFVDKTSRIDKHLTHAT